HGLHDGGGDQEKCADTVYAANGPENAEHVSRVVAELGENRQQAGPKKPAPVEGDIFVVNLLRVFFETFCKVVAQVKEFQLFGGFLAAANLAKIIHLAADRSLVEVFGVEEKRKMAFA